MYAEDVGATFNNDLWKIDKWAKANELCMNLSKFKCLLHSRAKGAFNVLNIIIRGNKIDFVESPANLRVIFICRLNTV